MRVDSDIQPERTKSLPEPPVDMDRAPILAIDDEESIRNLLVNFLSPTYECVAVETAEEAFEAMKKKAFRLVITDLKLPGASGFDVARHVKTRYPDTPVVMMTGMHGAQYARQALDEGVYSFLTKPIDMPRLIGLIQSALRHELLAASRRRKA
jgi:DNA-binding NtrC family response regulator